VAGRPNATLVSEVHRQANLAFNLFWAGQSVSSVGYFVSMVAIPLLAINRLHASTFEVTALEALEWAPAMFIGLYAGVLVDRSCRKRLIMIIAGLVQAAATGSIPVAAAAGVITLGGVFAAAFVSGLAGVFFQTAYPAFLRGIVPADQLVAANARLQGSQSAAQISGPALGGVLVQVIGSASAVMADAASFLVSVITLVFIRVAEPDGVQSRHSVRLEVTQGLRYLATSPVLRSLAIVSTLANLLLTAIGAVEVVFLVRVVGVAPGSIGVLLAITGAGGLAGALMASRLQRMFGTSLVARAALACTAPFAMLLPFTHRGAALALFAIGAFVPCFGIVVIGITLASIRQTVCPQQLLGRVSSVFRLLMAISMPVGALAGGGLGQHLGLRSALLVVTVALTLVGVGTAAGSLRHASDLSLSAPTDS